MRYIPLLSYKRDLSVLSLIRTDLLSPVWRVRRNFVALNKAVTMYSAESYIIFPVQTSKACPTFTNQLVLSRPFASAAWRNLNCNVPFKCLFPFSLSRIYFQTFEFICRIYSPYPLVERFDGSEKIRSVDYIIFPSRCIVHPLRS